MQHRCRCDGAGSSADASTSADDYLSSTDGELDPQQGDPADLRADGVRRCRFAECQLHAAVRLIVPSWDDHDQLLGHRRAGTNSVMQRDGRGLRSRER